MVAVWCAYCYTPLIKSPTSSLSLRTGMSVLTFHIFTVLPSSAAACVNATMVRLQSVLIADGGLGLGGEGALI